VTIPVGAVRYFAVSIIDPPALARDMDVDFVLDKPVQKAPAAHSSDTKPGPSASEPPQGAAKEVKPLPADSPYALHDAEGAGGEAHAAPAKAVPAKAGAAKPAPAHGSAKGHE
jgi:hypothetical protein